MSMLWFLIAVSTVVMSSSLNLGIVRASKVLYELINKRIFRNPICLFDTTPIGRILNRVSKDIDTIDNVLPMTLTTSAGTFFSVNSRYVTIIIYALSNHYHLAGISLNNCILDIKYQICFFFFLKYKLKVLD